MRLKNKKTGEIGLVHCDATMFSNKIGVFIDNNHIDLRNPYKIYTSLAELNEEWEDYEEPDEIWYIDWQGNIRSADIGDEWEREKEIGNYFESREDAEKAVEKLKAWERLKDKGFRFILTPSVGSLDITPGKFQIEINAEMPEKWFCCDAVQKDLDECFGGEE